MQKLEIKGGRKISGTIIISGSKNATLPILASTILTHKKVVIKNIPIVKDVLTMVELLNTIGSTIKFDKKRKKIVIFNKVPLKTFAPYHLLKTMRAGVLVLGPLLAKYKIAKVSLPGGCAIGSRPIIAAPVPRAPATSPTTEATFSTSLACSPTKVAPRFTACNAFCPML